MQFNIRKARFLLYFVMACGLVPLFYIVLSTDGNVWVERSLLLGKNVSLALCVAALVLGVLERSGMLSIGAIALLLLWIVVPVFGQVNCVFGGLSGGYDRHTNCGLNTTIYIGIAAFALVAAMQGKAAVSLLLLTCLVVPAGFAGTRFYISNGLSQKLASANLEKECFVRQSNYHASPFDKASATRVQDFADVQLGWIIGEQSPRIFRLTGGTAYVWEFSQRTFTPVSAAKGLIAFCNS